MRRDDVLKRVVVFSFILLLMHIDIRISAQNTLIRSESDYAKLTIFADNGKTNDTLVGKNGEIIHIEAPGYIYQRIDKFNWEVDYSCFIAFEDNVEEGLESHMILQIGGNTTKFCSWRLHAADSSMQYDNGREIEALFKKANPLFVNDVYYTDIPENELTFICRFASEDYYYKETLSIINWIIMPQTKEICGHICKKANGLFRGRYYEAWFAEDMPISSGPWKLRGLPGLILEAQEINGLCRFSATSVKQHSGYIEKPSYNYYKINRKEYQSMLAQYMNAPLRFQSMHLNTAPGIRIIPPAKETPLRKIVILEIE